MSVASASMEGIKEEGQGPSGERERDKGTKSGTAGGHTAKRDGLEQQGCVDVWDGPLSYFLLI